VNAKAREHCIGRRSVRSAARVGNKIAATYLWQLVHHALRAHHGLSIVKTKGATPTARIARANNKQNNGTLQEGVNYTAQSPALRGFHRSI
jgi:hypothetical protein